MYTDNREAYRRAFYDAWQKHLKKLPLEIIEAQMVKVISHHPEYHALLENQQRCLREEFPLEENPFFHLSLHMTILEQLQLNRPVGIKEIYQGYLANGYQEHDAMHLMVDCLAQTLWQAQQTGLPPNEKDYLDRLKNTKIM